jgi:hypothetical protein
MTDMDYGSGDIVKNYAEHEAGGCIQDCGLKSIPSAVEEAAGYNVAPMRPLSRALSFRETETANLGSFTNLEVHRKFR